MTPTTPPTCFVISPFGEPYDTYFRKILKPAIEKCDLYAVRGDSLFRPTTIVDDIWVGIKNASVLIAELTGRNPNVFYELGLAHAISKPVILLANDIDDVPFDLRAIRVLVYDKDQPDWGQSLRADLIKALKEVLASPGLAVPTTFKEVVRTSPPVESELMVRIETLESGLRALSGSGATAELGYRPTAPLRLPKTAKPGPNLHPGQKVSHRKFGEGVVLMVEGHGRNQRVQVNFDEYGLKLIAQAVAHMQPCES